MPLDPRRGSSKSSRSEGGGLRFDDQHGVIDLTDKIGLEGLSFE